MLETISHKNNFMLLLLLRVESLYDPRAIARTWLEPCNIAAAPAYTIRRFTL